MTTFDSPDRVEHAPCGTLHNLDTSDMRDSYVLDCDSGVQIRLSELAYRVLAAVWSGATFDEIAVQCSDDVRRLAVHEVERLYDLVVAQVDAAEKHQRKRGTDQGFWLRVTLIPASLARHIAAPVASLFQPIIALPATLLIACAAAYWLTTHHIAPPPLSGGQLLAGCALFVISCLAHELGHAGACIRFGVRPGSIGLAFYLMFPVLYSDVTRIWRLRRWHRVAVDVGGSYVQCLCGALYAVVYTQTHAPALVFAIALIITATLLNMNPLFRFDGYWIVSDALGVPGLTSHVGRLVRRLARRDDVALPPWPGHIVAAVTIYSIVALVGWAWFVANLIAYMLEQGRWLLTVVPAMGPDEWMSLAFFGQLGSAAIGAIALAFFLIKLSRALRSRCAYGPRR